MSFRPIKPANSIQKGRSCDLLHDLKSKSAINLPRFCDAWKNAQHCTLHADAFF
jgi:hypothetical protein